MAKEARIYNREKTVSLIIGFGETGQIHVKEWNWKIWSHAIKKKKKNTIKMDKTLKTIKLQEENIGSILFDMSAVFFVSVSSSMGNKSNNKEMWSN